MKIEILKSNKELKTTSIKTNKKDLLVMATSVPFKHKKERLNNNFNLSNIYTSCITNLIFNDLKNNGLEDYDKKIKNNLLKASLTLYKYLKDNKIEYVKHDQPLCDLFIIYIDKSNIHTISMGDFAINTDFTDHPDIFKFTQNTSVASIRKVNTKLFELEEHKKEHVFEYDKIKLLYALYKNQQNQQNFVTVYPEQTLLKHKQFSINNIKEMDIMSGIVLMNQPFLKNEDYHNILKTKDLLDINQALLYKSHSIFTVQPPEIVKIKIK